MTMFKQGPLLLALCLLLPFSLFGCAKDSNPRAEKSTLRKEGRMNTQRTNNPAKPFAQLGFDEYSIIFAFSDTNGKDILAISDTLPDPQIYTHTISEEGKIIPVKYQGKKTGDEEKDFQQVYGNFENCGGYLFRATGGRVDYKKVNVLLTDNFLKERKYIKNLLPEKKNIDKAILDSLETSRQKKVKSSFPVAKIDGEGILYAVNYELAGDTAMFSFVFVSRHGLIIKDNYGEYDPGGTWRAGDNGYVKPGMFEVLAAFMGKNGIEIAIDWKGSEGDYIEYLLENGDTLEMVKNEYRYTLPN